jgi:hypothetical protein
MLDWIESMECAAECRLDEMTDGLPAGMFRCDCGKIDTLANAMPAFDSPYAPPMCNCCFRAAAEKVGD